MITNGGTLVRTRACEISVIGRNTQGLRLIRLTKDESLVSVEAVQEVEGDSSNEDHDGGDVEE